VCGECAEACPTGARALVGRETTVQELLAEVLRDNGFYDDSEGGVTFSGGEPLSQPDFLGAMLQACRKRGLHTAVDTCGFAPRAQLLEVARWTSLFLYDLKCMNRELHRRHTGVDNQLILDNLRALGRAHANIWVRVPVIPGVNDAEEELRATAEFAAHIEGVRQVNLLPYHATGAAKARRIGRTPCQMASPPPDPRDIEEAAAIFREAGVTVKAGG